MQIDLDKAIQVSKILSKAPEERIPMILSVFELADLIIDGYEALEEWKAFKDQAYLVDTKEFINELAASHPPDENGDMKLKPEEFRAACEKWKLKPTCCKRSLMQSGHLKAVMEGSKLSYTVVLHADGAPHRFVVININPVYKRQEGDSYDRK